MRYDACNDTVIFTCINENSNYVIWNINSDSRKLHSVTLSQHNPIGRKYSRTLGSSTIITPHAQRERGKVIGRGVHIYIYIYIYICLWSKKKFESYFRDRLTFSNVDSRTSRRIYRLALLLHAPETLSSLSKSRISIFNAHLTLLVRKMTSHNSIGKYRHLVN